MLFSRMFFLVFLYKPCLVFVILLSRLTKLSFIIVKNITITYFPIGFINVTPSSTTRSYTDMTASPTINGSTSTVPMSAMVHLGNKL